ncbi:MAG TPA: hypothetical protein VGV38_13970 [Pyrinomonadaceae bacterium]|nr:hypothetical protein [Pyrinomonadaceae bacterium]
MSRQVRIARLFVLAFALILGLGYPAAAVQKDKDDKKKKAPPTGTPVLWREPTDIATRNLLLGPGGEAMKPDWSKLTFIREETGGYSKKYRVRDAAGRVWVAKIGKESQSETAASRLVWAAGYYSEVQYLAPSATIEGKGTFENVRLEARPDEWDRLEIWKWEQNPFTGTRELQGLKVLMALLENWDIKDDNNKIVYVPGPNGQNELRYIISDLGATFGKTDSPGGVGSWLRQIRGTRNEPGDFAGDKFITGVQAGKVVLDYEGKNSKMMKDVTVEDARWLGSHLSKLSDEQIADAFRAANYDAEDVRLLTRAVRSRIDELVNLK